jgi:hypothetical protein
MEMKPLLPLFHEEDLGPNLVSGLNEIHVLVKLPERRVTLHTSCGLWTFTNCSCIT